jgi:predicted enzyme related to lactoylglutathione lyase
MKNALNWFEIPATDIERAAMFYCAIPDTKLAIGEMSPGFLMAMLPADEGAVGGAIVQGEGYEPSTEGSLVWLNGGDDLNVVLNRVEAAGGKVLIPKMSIGEHGFAASFLDSEGNKVGLHSMAWPASDAAAAAMVGGLPVAAAGALCVMMSRAASLGGAPIMESAWLFQINASDGGVLKKGKQ